MVTNWFGGNESLLWSCGMKCVLQVPVDPGQEVGLGSVMVVVMDLDHNDTLQGLLDPFWKNLEVQSYLRICKDTFIH